MPFARIPFPPLTKLLFSTLVSVTLSSVRAVPAKLANVRSLIVLPEAFGESTMPEATVSDPKIETLSVAPRTVTGRLRVIVFAKVTSSETTISYGASGSVGRSLGSFKRAIASSIEVEFSAGAPIPIAAPSRKSTLGAMILPPLISRMSPSTRRRSISVALSAIPSVSVLT